MINGIQGQYDVRPPSSTPLASFSDLRKAPLAVCLDAVTFFVVIGLLAVAVRAVRARSGAARDTGSSPSMLLADESAIE
jgi:hypothetical protein